MKMRIALLSGLLTLVAGAALAIPTTQSVTAADQDQDQVLTAWDELLTPSIVDPTLEPDAVELAVYGPCGCIPIPGCPFPLPWPWPPGGSILVPFPGPYFF